MSTKKKPGNKKKKADKLEKLSRVEETFYELTVADCTKKLTQLRNHLNNLVVSNVDIKERIRSLHEDKVDTAANLTRDVKSAEKTIFTLNVKISVISGKHFEEKTRGDTIISDLEDKYKAMHDQLSAEIKLLKAKLKMLNEFPKQEAKMNLVNEQTEQRMKAKEQECKNALNAMERKIQLERKTICKNVERSLLNVAEDFRRANTSRNASYTQRLIRENIALNKEVYVLQRSHQAIEAHLKEQIARHKEVKATFPALERKKRDLILIAQQRTNLVEQLTSKYEKLKTSYVECLKYKNHYKQITQYQLCEHKRRYELIRQAKNLGTKTHILKTECLHMNFEYEQNEREIISLEDIITLIRRTILKTLNIIENRNGNDTRKVNTNPTISFSKASENKGIEEFCSEEHEKYNEIDIKPENLLKTLLCILNYYKVHKSSSDSIETIPADQLLIHHPELCQNSTDSLREAFKFNQLHDKTQVVEETDLESVEQLSKIIPQEQLKRCLVFDVEKGTSLYITSSENDPEKMSIHSKMDDDEDQLEQNTQSFDSDFSASSIENTEDAQPLTKSVVKATESQISLSQLPAGTIIDVEMDEEFYGTEEETMSVSGAKDLEDILNTSAETHEEEEEEMPTYMFY